MKKSVADRTLERLQKFTEQLEGNVNLSQLAQEMQEIAENEKFDVIESLAQGKVGSDSPFARDIEWDGVKLRIQLTKMVHPKFIAWHLSFGPRESNIKLSEETVKHITTTFFGDKELREQQSLLRPGEVRIFYRVEMI